MTTYVDSKGKRWLLAPFYGPTAQAAVGLFAKSHGPTVNGELMAFTVEGPAAHPTLQPQWISADLDLPGVAVVANDVIRILANGDRGATLVQRARRPPGAGGPAGGPRPGGPGGTRPAPTLPLAEVNPAEPGFERDRRGVPRNCVLLTGAASKAATATQEAATPPMRFYTHSTPKQATRSIQAATRWIAGTITAASRWPMATSTSPHTTPESSPSALQQAIKLTTNRGAPPSRPYRGMGGKAQPSTSHSQQPIECGCRVPHPSRFFAKGGKPRTPTSQSQLTTGRRAPCNFFIVRKP